MLGVAARTVVVSPAIPIRLEAVLDLVGTARRLAHAITTHAAVAIARSRAVRSIGARAAIRGTTAVDATFALVLDLVLARRSFAHSVLAVLAHAIAGVFAVKTRRARAAIAAAVPIRLCAVFVVVLTGGLSASLQLRITPVDRTVCVRDAAFVHRTRARVAAIRTPAIHGGLVAILDVVVTAWRLAHLVTAHQTLAVFRFRARRPVGTGRITFAAAVLVRLGTILDAVVTARVLTDVFRADRAVAVPRQ